MATPFTQENARRSNCAMRGQVAILPFEIQQWLCNVSLLQIQSFHLTNHYHVITCDVLIVDFTVEPVQAVGNDGIT